MEKIRTPLIIIISLLIGIFGYSTYLSYTQDSDDETKSSRSEKVQADIALESTSKADSQNRGEESEWSTYSSAANGFSISHPSDLPPKQEEGALIFAKWGPSQKEGTGFYDGISLRISKGTYSGNLFLFVTDKLTEIKNGPVYEESSEIFPYSRASYNGYAFRVTAMGAHEYIYLQKKADEYIEIINSTQDPTSQGFDEIVDTMLNSLTLQ